MNRYIPTFLYAQLLLLPLLTVSLFTQHPVFAYGIESPKWIAMYVGAVGYLIFQLRNPVKQIIFPKKLLPFVVVYILGILIIIIKGPSAYTEKTFTESLLFIILTLWTLYVLEKEKQALVSLDLWNVLSIPFFLAVTGYSLFVQKNSTFPFFGSPMMLGEYLGISLTLQLFAIFFLRTRRIWQLGMRFLLLFVSIGFLIHSGAGASMCGVIVVFGAFVFAKVFQKDLPKKNKKILSALAVVILFGGSFAIDQITRNTVAKQENIDLRLARWKNTLGMIKKNPLGVGLGNFETVYKYYQDSAAVDSVVSEDFILTNPHNAYLKLAAENGILCAFAVIFGLVVLGIALLRRSRMGHLRSVLALALLLFLSIDAFFNFPQDTPYVFFIMAFTAALILIELGDLKFRFTPSAYKGFVIGALMVFLYFPYRQFMSEHLIFTRSNEESAVIRACRLDAQNWRACLGKISYDWKAGRKDAAVQTLDKLSVRFPGHFAVKRKTIELLWATGDQVQACQEAREYDKLFYLTSSLSKVIEANCKN